MDDRVARLLQDYAWPGNVGELERVIKRACIVARSDVIGVDDIGESLGKSRFPARADAGDAVLARAVRSALQDRLVQQGRVRVGLSRHPRHRRARAGRRALTITNGNQVKAADILGVNRATLRKKIPED